MIRNICLLICLLSSIPLIIGCSKIESSAKEEIELSHSYEVPSEYNHSKTFLDSITKHGIKITEINNSNTMALFQTKHNYAMYINSELGNFVLIHLEYKNGKEFTFVKKESKDGRFKYLIKDGKHIQLYDTNAETYFNKNKEYITITQSKELNKKLKKVLEIN